VAATARAGVVASLNFQTQKCQQKCQQTLSVGSKMGLKKVSESGLKLTLTKRIIAFIINVSVMI
jgi:hypothetical protein